MKINLKKVLVSLFVIVGFVFYAVYQRYFVAQQAIVNNAPPDTIADGTTSETVTTTTINQTDNQSANQDSTLSATNPPETLAGNDIGDDNEEDDGSVQQQTTQGSSGQTTSGNTSTTTAAASGSTTSTTTTSGNTSTTAAAATTAPANALYKDGQYDGNAADAYYGLVQVRAVVQGGKLTDVIFLCCPNDRSESIKINTYATPILSAEAIKAQSAKVNIVTGATNTSRAFINSLTTALSQAKA